MFHTRKNHHPRLSLPDYNAIYANARCALNAKAQQFPFQKCFTQARRDRMPFIKRKKTLEKYVAFSRSNYTSYHLFSTTHSKISINCVFDSFSIQFESSFAR